MSSVHHIDTGAIGSGAAYSFAVTRFDAAGADGRTAIGIEVLGGVDRIVAGQLRNQLLTVAKEHPASISVDMRNVVVVDGACLAVLVEAWRFCDEHGIELAVRSPAVAIRETFAVAPSGRILAIRA
jgi:anti-anti-sigma factor